MLLMNPSWLKVPGCLAYEAKDAALTGSAAVMLRVSGTALEYRFGDTPPPCGAEVDTSPMEPVVRCCIDFCCMTLRLRSSHLEILSWKAGRGCISSLSP